MAPLPSVAEIGDGWFPNFELSRISQINVDLPLGANMSFYGQFSPVAMMVSDGMENYRSLNDNNHSVSRFGTVVQRDLLGGLFQFQFETSLGLRNSKQPSQFGRGDALTIDQSNIRLVDFSWKSPRGQVFSLGQGKMATDGVTSLDLSRTGIANSVSIPDIAGGYRFRTKGGVISNIQVSDVFQTFDGIRRVRFRFDTRSRHGIWFSVSAGAEVVDSDSDQKDIDAAVFYSMDRDAFLLQAAAGQSISEERGENVRADTVGSVSILHKRTGLNATFATGSRLGEGGYGYLKLGYLAQLSSMGPTAFAVDIMRTENTVQLNTSGTAWGIAIVQIVEALNTEFFVGYRNFSFTEDRTVQYEDVETVFFGSRIRF